MARMLLLAVVLYIATRLHFDGEAAAPQLLDLFAKAGMQLTARDLDGFSVTTRVLSADSTRER